MSRKTQSLLYLTIIVFALPIVITAAGSFLSDGMPTLSRYEELFGKTEFIRHSALTFIYSAVSAVGSVIVSIPAAFLFAKGKFRFRSALFFLYILAMMLPFQATMLPQYIILRDLGFLNTPAAFIIYTVFSPVSVFLLRQFIVAVPDELIHSAMLDTESVLRIILHIVIPMIKPAIFTVLIFNFFESWNMYEQALTFSAQNKEILPLSAVMKTFPDTAAPAASAVYMLPSIVLFYLLKTVLLRSDKK